jgi:hypothetical protein
MQVSKKTAKDIYGSLQNVSPLSTYSSVEKIETFHKELSTKPYYARYKELFYLCVFLSLAAQNASIISSYAYFEGVFGVAIKNPYLLVLAVATFLVTIEALKRILLNNSLQSWYGLQRLFAPIPTLFAIILSVLSMYASTIGGGSLGVDTKKEVITGVTGQSNIDSLAKVYDTEIGVIRSEIQDIKHRNSFRGATYIAGRDKALLLGKEQRLATLQGAKEQDILSQKQQAAMDLETVRKENQANKQVYQYWFLGFELLFLACMTFVYDYKRKVVLETLLTDNSPTTAKVDGKIDVIEDTNTITPPAPLQQSTQPQRIGFIFGKQTAKEHLPTNDNRNENSNTIIVNENRRVCLHCQNEYTYKHHKQLYCTENCRVLAWEQRTGKKLNRGAKVKSL